MSSNTVTTHVSKRTVFGSKLKSYRKQGILPANIFGKGVESLSIELGQKQFHDLFEEVGETGLITMDVDGGEKRTVIVSNYTNDPITGEVSHVDFRQVNLKEAISANVPIVLVGIAPADDLGAVIVQSLDELEVEALPTDLPEEIEIDISSLAELGDVIAVKDVKVSDKVTLLADPEIVIVMAQEVKEEVEEEPEETTETEIAGGTQGEEAKEGDDEAAEKKPEPKKE